MYPYGYYTTSSKCHDKGLELIDSGDITRYICFYERSGPKAGWYHLYTN